MTKEVITAILNAMQVEKNAMNFYLACARQSKDEKCRNIFNLLASEEREHAHRFFAIAPEAGDESKFVAFIDKDDAAEGLFGDIDKVVADFTESKAMLLALDKEKAMAEQLRAMAAFIADPELKKVYEWNARSTDHHYQLIEEEYSRLMAMVHAADVDIYVRE
jgi:rubrerythrin